MHADAIVPSTSRTVSLGSSQMRATTVDKMQVAEDAIHCGLNDRSGMLITQQDLTTTPWSKL